MSIYVRGCDCGACCNRPSCCTHPPSCMLRQGPDIDLADPCTECGAEPGENCRSTCPNIN